MSQETEEHGMKKIIFGGLAVIAAVAASVGTIRFLATGGELLDRPDA